MCGAYITDLHARPQVWDLRRLERDVSFRSRLTYSGQPGAITAVAGVEDGQSGARAVIRLGSTA